VALRHSYIEKEKERFTNDTYTFSDRWLRVSRMLEQMLNDARAGVVIRVWF
jgi:hypothetical protein